MKRPWLGLLILPFGVLLTSCGSIDFDAANEGDTKKEGLKYYEPTPYLLIQSTLNESKTSCVYNVQVVMVPTKEKRIKLKPGLLGTSELSVTLTNGMISNVGQTTNPATAEMLTALTGTYTAIGSLVPFSNSDEKPKVSPPICKAPRLLKNEGEKWVPAEAGLSL